MDSNHRMTESESVALPLGEAPIKMAGVDGVKPPFADLESAVLLTELNSLKHGQGRIRTCGARTPELQKLHLKPLGHPTITKDDPVRSCTPVCAPQASQWAPGS